MRRTIILAGIVLSLFLKLVGQETPPAQPPGVEAGDPVRRVSLEECIDLALKNNFAIRIQEYSPQLVGYDLKAAYGAYDPEFRFSAVRRSTLSPGGLDTETGQTFGLSEREVDTISSGVSGVLPTGLTYDFTGTLNENNGFNQRRLVTGVLTNETFAFSEGSLGALNLSQPFLRDLWIDGTRRTIKILKKDVESSELQFRFTVMDVVAQTQLAYYELMFALTNIVVAQDALKLSERSVYEVKKKVEVGKLAELEQKQADAEVERARSDVIAARYNAKVRENALKSLITDNYAEWQPIRLLPTETLEARPREFDRGATWLEALKKRPDYKQQLLALDKANIQLRYTRNQLFPRLDAFGSYGRSAIGLTAGDTLGELRRGEFDQHVVGLRLTVPFSFRSERYAHKAAKAAREQEQARVDQLQQNILIEVDDAVNRVESLLLAVSATRQARIFAEAALEAEQKKFESGTSTTFFVLELQSALTTARRDEIRALVDYHQALVDLDFRKGTTLERQGIQLE